jgi:hypothetical protein
VSPNPTLRRFTGVRASDVYVDVGTVHGYREALAMLDGVVPAPTATAGAPRG